MHIIMRRGGRTRDATWSFITCGARPLIVSLILYADRTTSLVKGLGKISPIEERPVPSELVLLPVELGLLGSISTEEC